MIQPRATHPSGRHRPRPVDSAGKRPAGIPAPVIVSWYWVRRTAMVPLHLSAGHPSGQVVPS